MLILCILKYFESVSNIIVNSYSSLVSNSHTPPHLHTCTCTHTHTHFHSYLNFIQDTVYRSPSQAYLGGVPGTLNLVKSFLRLHQVNTMPGIEDELVDGQPLWAIVFYCIRCGDMEDALAAVREAPYVGCRRVLLILFVLTNESIFFRFQFA